MGKGQLPNQYHLLKGVAASYQLEKGIDADEFLFTYPDINYIAYKLKESEGRWPAFSRAYGLCISVADRIENKTLHFDFKENPVEVTLTGRLTPSSGRGGKQWAVFSYFHHNGHRGQARCLSAIKWFLCSGLLKIKINPRR